MENDCSACQKGFKVGDKAVRSNCGHFVHCFKADCCEKDFCRQCNKEFRVSSNSPIVTLRCTSQKYENIVDEEEIKPERLETSRVKEYFKGNTCDERNSYYLEKLEEQRKINLEIMKKINLLTNNHECLIKLISEQTQNFKIIVTELTKMRTEIDKVKTDVSEVTERVVDLLNEVFEEPCTHC